MGCEETTADTLKPTHTLTHTAALSADWWMVLSAYIPALPV